MKLFVILSLSITLFGASSFITDEEYASSFYKNPRGIGCHNCHGENGKGRLVARYKQDNKIKSFRGSDITNIGFKDFYESLDSRVAGMPKYFLTKDEIEALYRYLHRVKKQ